MKKKQQKQSFLKRWLAKGKAVLLAVSAYSKANHLSLLSLALSLAILVKLELLEDKLLNVYINLSQGLGVIFMALLQIAAGLFGGDPA